MAMFQRRKALRSIDESAVNERRSIDNSRRKGEVVVGASNENDEKQIQSFSNSNITFAGELAGYDYDSILRDKQKHIVELYQLSDYYTDADSIIRGIVKHCYVPCSASTGWMLTGAKDKTIITVYNKIDKLPEDSGLPERLAQEENAICISAKSGLNLDKLLELISENLKLKSVEVELLVPYEESEVTAKLHRNATILDEVFTPQDGNLMKIRIDAEQVAEYQEYIDLAELYKEAIE